MDSFDTIASLEFQFTKKRRNKFSDRMQKKKG